VHHALWGDGQPAATRSEKVPIAAALARARSHLERAVEALPGNLLEVVAGEVALAQEALGEAAGAQASESVLEGVFRRFCIGK
jgi:tRNA U34 5-carboxymethylaminomethyl modifying GTPase MnmE/TrmE